MLDVHLGKGATIGSVVPTKGAIIPAAVGVDIGCGMMAVQTSLSAGDLPDNPHALRSAIEAAVPHGKTFGARDQGAFAHPGAAALKVWVQLVDDFARITGHYPHLAKANHVQHLGPLGTGQSFHRTLSR